MTEPGDESRRTPDGEDGRPPVYTGATVADGAPFRSDGGIDTTATGPGERVPGGSIQEHTAVDRPQTREREVLGEPDAHEKREVTVLHVDDDPDVGDLVSYFLEEAVDDVTVLTETDPAATIDRVARVDVDCVVSDLEMPDMDGLDLALALDATHPDVSVVLFTSRDWGTVAGEAGTECVTAHVRKEGGHRQFERLARRVRALLA